MFSESVYKVRARSWGYRETTNGYDQFEMTFEVLGEVDRNNPEDPACPCEAGIRSWSITLKSDDNAEWLSSVVLDLGYDRDDLLGLDPDTPEAFNFEGVEFFASCKHEEYNGQIREKWSVCRSSKKVLSKDRLQDLNRRYGGAIREVRERRAMKSSTTVTPPQGNTDPF